MKRIVAAVVVLIIVAWWLRREPAWSVAVAADPSGPSSEVTPWQSIAVTATVAPADALAGRWLHGGTWHYTWTADGAPLAITGASGTYRSGKLGDHTITVTVTSPWGTEHSASLHATVRYRGYMTPDSPALHEPDVATLPKDPSPEALPFGIADVWVEKTRVCQGEPTRIRLTPFDKRGQDKWLVPVVAGEQAWEVAYTVPPTRPGPRMVPITLYDNGSKGGKVDSIDTYVYIEVLDCIAPIALFVDHRPIPPDDDNISFRARAFDGPAWLARLKDPKAPSPAAQVATYAWTFGDGTTATTTEPRITHRFPAEPDRPDERATLYKVQVDAKAAAGKVVATSYASIVVPNHHRELKHDQGLVQLVTQQAPGAQESADGSHFADVVLANLDATETARITAMKIELTSCDGKSLGTTTADPSTVFKDLVVAPHAKIAGRFTLAAPGQGVCFANAEVSGTSEPGKLNVLGFFQLITTNETPGVALTDEQDQVLQQAMKLLGNPKVVTNEDLLKLEADGKIPRGVLTKDPFSGEAPPAPE
jgi:hypothetical protein